MLGQLRNMLPGIQCSKPRQPVIRQDDVEGLVGRQRLEGLQRIDMLERAGHPRASQGSFGKPVVGQRIFKMKNF